SVTTLPAGLRCSPEEGRWHQESDLPGSLGGSGAAPTPGVLLRAALGSCMAMSYQLRAAKHGVALTSIRVTVEADSELAGMLLCDASAPPGYTELRYHVDVESPAPAADVLRVIDEGDQLSPLLDVFTRSNTIRRTTSIRPVGG
ncbi:MAG: OsmC family protein, partial [Actinomycetota bacterium]|nr:OsmC family protein [Actinomycetota bacterium]